MKCFVSQAASLASEDVNHRFSKVIQVFASYIRAQARNAAQFVVVSEADAKSLGLGEVSSKIGVFDPA